MLTNRTPQWYAGEADSPAPVGDLSDLLRRTWLRVTLSIPQLLGSDHRGGSRGHAGHYPPDAADVSPRSLPSG
jgi:hypothetical protein